MSPQLNIRVEDELLAEMKQYADAAGESLTTYVKVAVRLRMDPPVIGRPETQVIPVERPSEDSRQIYAPPKPTLPTRTYNPVSPPTAEYLAMKEAARKDAIDNCVHPISRRIGKTCGFCGKDMK